MCMYSLYIYIYIYVNVYNIYMYIYIYIYIYMTGGLSIGEGENRMDVLNTADFDEEEPLLDRYIYTYIYI